MCVCVRCPLVVVLLRTCFLLVPLGRFEGALEHEFPDLFCFVQAFEHSRVGSSFSFDILVVWWGSMRPMRSCSGGHVPNKLEAPLS